MNKLYPNSGRDRSCNPESPVLFFPPRPIREKGVACESICYSTAAGANSIASGKYDVKEGIWYTLELMVKVNNLQSTIYKTLTTTTPHSHTGQDHESVH